jgi:hypothetical protein
MCGHVPKLLQGSLLSTRARMWYMHGGAAAYFSRAMRAMRDVLYDICPVMAN